MMAAVLASSSKARCAGLWVASQVEALLRQAAAELEVAAGWICPLSVTWPAGPANAAGSWPSFKVLSECRGSECPQAGFMP
jgi:hypothetical protein